MPHLLWCPRGSFMKIFFAKLLKLPFSRKFRDAKIPQYTVVISKKKGGLELVGETVLYGHEFLSVNHPR